jgi:hypothetical protein
MNDREAWIVELAREVVLDGPPVTVSGCCFHCDQPIAWPENGRQATHARYCLWAQLAEALAVLPHQSRH